MGCLVGLGRKYQTNLLSGMFGKAVERMCRPCGWKNHQYTTGLDIESDNNEVRMGRERKKEYVCPPASPVLSRPAPGPCL